MAVVESPPDSAALDYEEWITLIERGPEEIAALRARGTASASTVSVICVGDHSDEVWMRATITSLRAQTHAGWELVVCSEPGDEAAAGALASYPEIADRVVEVSSPMATAVRAGLDHASGELVCRLLPGDQLRCDALHDITSLAETAGSDAIYTDDDVIAISGERRAPRFRPRFSPDLLLCTPYVGRLCVARTELVRELGGFSEELGENMESELLLRIAERSDRIHHLPGIRFHRRDPLADERSRPLTEKSGWRRVVRTALTRRSDRGTVGSGSLRGTIRVRHPAPAGAKLSAIVMASRSAQAEHLPALGWLADLGPKVSDIILAGPGPDALHRGVEHGMPARAANLAAEQATGDFLLFVDGRCRLGPDSGENWLEEMLGHAARPGIGAVGARIVDPRGWLVSGPTTMDPELLDAGPDAPAPVPAPESRRRRRPEEESPLERVVLNPGLVGGRAMMIERRLFERLGCFDAASLPAALFDADLSLRLLEQGLRNVYTPHATFVLPPSPRRPGPGEVATMWERWWDQLTLLGYYAAPPMTLASPPIDAELLANLIAAGSRP